MKNKLKQLPVGPLIREGGQQSAKHRNTGIFRGNWKQMARGRISDRQQNHLEWQCSPRAAVMQAVPGTQVGLSESGGDQESFLPSLWESTKQHVKSRGPGCMQRRILSRPFFFFNIALLCALNKSFCLLQASLSVFVNWKEMIHILCKDLFSKLCER